MREGPDPAQGCLEEVVLEQKGQGWEFTGSWSILDRMNSCEWNHSLG